jgi:hypothetical protein
MERSKYDPKSKRPHFFTRPKFISFAGKRKTSEPVPVRTSLSSPNRKHRRTRKFCDQEGIPVKKIITLLSFGTILTFYAVFGLFVNVV